MSSDGTVIEAHDHHMQHHLPRGHTAVFSLSTDTGPLLFEWWHPRSLWAYVASLVVVFALSSSAELLHSFCARAGCGRAPAASIPADELARMYSEDETPQRRRHQHSSLATTLQEGAIHTLAVTLHFAVMLLAMSFNVGVFAAAVLGVATSRTMTRR